MGGWGNPQARIMFCCGLPLPLPLPLPKWRPRRIVEKGNRVRPSLSNTSDFRLSIYLFFVFKNVLMLGRKTQQNASPPDTAVFAGKGHVCPTVTRSPIQTSPLQQQTGGALFQRPAFLKPLSFPKENQPREPRSSASGPLPSPGASHVCLLFHLFFFFNFIIIIFGFGFGLSLDCFVGVFLTRPGSLPISTVNFLVQQEGEHRAGSGCGAGKPEGPRACAHSGLRSRKKG